MMTRKNFEAAASIVRGARPEVKRAVAASFIYFFHADNPRFDMVRFLNACQLPPEGQPADLPPPT